MSRVLTDKLSSFKVFADAVETHISHQYQDQVAEKSEIVRVNLMFTCSTMHVCVCVCVCVSQVPLGVLLKAESKTEDVIDILSCVQQYTPIASDGRFQPILFGGDQLTRERAVHAQERKTQSPDMLARLQEVIPKSEDWHALVIFYRVLIMMIISYDNTCIITYQYTQCMHI